MTLTMRPGWEKPKVTNGLRWFVGNVDGDLLTVAPGARWKRMRDGVELSSGSSETATLAARVGHKLWVFGDDVSAETCMAKIVAIESGAYRVEWLGADRPRTGRVQVARCG